jgi:hypothetical protein
MRNEDDDAFQHDWQKFSRTDNQKFDDYISVDSHLVTSSASTVKELCESHVGATLLEGAEDEGDDTKPQVVPNFAEAQEALIKVKSCLHAQQRW